MGVVLGIVGFVVAVVVTGRPCLSNVLPTIQAVVHLGFQVVPVVRAVRALWVCFRSLVDVQLFGILLGEKVSNLEQVKSCGAG